MENVKQTVKKPHALVRMLKYLKDNDPAIIWFFVVYTICSSIHPVVGVVFPKYLITLLLGENVVINSVLFVVAIFFLISAVTSFLESYTFYASNTRITYLRIRYLFIQFKLFLTMDYKYVEDPTFGNEYELAFEACSSNNNGIEQIYHSMFEIVAKILSIIMYVVLVSMLTPWAFLAIFLSVIVGYFTSKFVERYRYSKRMELAHANRKTRYYNEVTYDFKFGKDIRLYGLGEKVMDCYRNEIFNYLKVFRRIKNKEYGWALFDLFFVLLSDITVYAFLIIKYLEGMDLASFTMYLGACLALSTALKTIIGDLTVMRNEMRYVKDFFRFIDTPLVTNDGTLPPPEDETLEVEFQNVSFKYPKTEKYIYKNLNLKIAKGEKLAIVGVNGAGKTTLVKLLTRLFDVEEGEILVNGVSIKQYELFGYLSMFSVVFQNINIYAFPVRQNVTMGHDRTDEEVWDCLIKAGLEEKIASLSCGLDHMLLKVIDENGVELSGGENQKLAIARALFKQAKMIILDEPTSALDALAEADIYQRFNELVSDKTTIYVSHRLASTKFCDKIAFFNENGLVEYGTHDELMALEGQYYNMFVTQGKYYQTEENDDETVA